MEGIIIAVIGASATIIAAFISKSSDNAQKNKSIQALEKKNDSQYESKNKGIIIQRSPINPSHSTSLNKEKKISRFVGVLFFLSALFCLFWAIFYVPYSGHPPSCIVFTLVVGIICGLIGRWLYRL